MSSVPPSGPEWLALDSATNASLSFRLSQSSCNTKSENVAKDGDTTYLSNVLTDRDVRFQEILCKPAVLLRIMRTSIRADMKRRLVSP